MWISDIHPLVSDVSECKCKHLYWPLVRSTPCAQCVTPGVMTTLASHWSLASDWLMLSHSHYHDDTRLSDLARHGGAPACAFIAIYQKSL